MQFEQVSFQISFECREALSFSEKQRKGIPDGGAENREGSFAKSFKGETRNCQKGGILRAECSTRLIRVNELREVGWHTVVVEALKTETGNLIMDPSFYRKPMQCFQ